MLQQAQEILRAATWTDTGLVFATESVIVTAGLPEDVMKDKHLPLALIAPAAENADPTMSERPDVVRMEFSVGVVVSNASDQFGEVTLLGGQRAGGSDGRGLLEVEEKIKTALLQLGPASGMPITFRSASGAEARMIGGLGYVAFESLRFEARGTTFRTYQPPSGLVATGGAGSVALSWNAATRWDARKFILRRATGATAPATSASGTGVTLSTDLATSVTDSVAAGTYSYSLFAVYDDTDSGTDVATSDPQTRPSVVAT